MPPCTSRSTRGGTAWCSASRPLSLPSHQSARFKPRILSLGTPSRRRPRERRPNGDLQLLGQAGLRNESTTAGAYGAHHDRSAVKATEGNHRNVRGLFAAREEPLFHSADDTWYFEVQHVE